MTSSASGRGDSGAVESLSVVVPALNEAGNLDSLIRGAATELATLVPEYEILVVNDGSADDTGTIADRLARELTAVRAFHHPRNIGFGGALRTGFRNSTKEWAVVVPADHQFRICDLRHLLEASAEADIVSSYRLDRKDSRRRRAASRFYHWYVAYRFGIHYRDINWVKMFRTSLLRAIEIESDGFCVDIEILLKARRLGCRVAEVPVDHYPRPWGVPTAISVRNVYRTARELARVKVILARSERARDPHRDAVVQPRAGA